MYKTLEGDLCQMGEQKQFLDSHGIVTGQINVYPFLKTEEDYIEALKLLFEHKVSGWWHYEKDYVRYNIN